MHKRSIITSLVVIFVMVSLIFVSSTQGRFIWIIPSAAQTAYNVITPELSVASIVLSFIVLLLLLFFFYSKIK